MTRITVRARPGKRLMVVGRWIGDEPVEVNDSKLIREHLKAGRLVASRPAGRTTSTGNGRKNRGKGEK